MTIGYKGMTKDYEYRIAEINFNEDNEKEKTLAERLIFFLKNVKGYSIDHSIYGYITYQVENMDEYKEFKRDYKEAKKMILNCMKYGF
ncbi:MAG: hypothetical protein ACLRVD_08235 [Blautia caecimuris]